jgi:type I restriction enzyme S subunit
MIDGLRPYAEMRPSGVEWLPALPQGWEIHRAKYSFKEADDRSEAGGEELLSVSHKTGVTPRSQKNITMFMAESYEGHKVCRPGDVVVNTMWAWMAAIGVSRHVGIVSPAYGIYRPRTADRFEPKFLDYLLRTEVYRAEYLRSSRGVTTSRLRLYPPDFLNIPFVQPPLDEQRLIVRFLDWHGAQTAKLIRAKKKIIALLNEQKQAIIHRAVTRGLDPNVRLKPSGIPWLGDVPEGWEVLPLKRIASFKSGAGFPVGEQGGEDLEIPFLKVSDMTLSGNERYIATWNNSISRETAAALGAYIFPPNTIIFPKVGGAMLTNKRRLLKQESCIDNNVMGSVVSKGILQYIFLILEQIDLGKISKPGPVPAIGEGEVREIRVAFPPIEEQREILEWLGSETRTVDQAANVASSEIALIQEFRTRLIADVVTGKLDVRAAAASLPETVELEPIDDLVEGDDLDEAVDDAENEEVAA